MKLTCFKVVILSTLMLLLTAPVISQVSAPPVKLQKEMYRAANHQLVKILELIPISEEGKYGFNNRDEFKRARLGILYQEFSLSDETPTGYWRIPVTVDRENRALLRMKMVNGKWQYAGFGAARLASELGFYEKKHAGKKAAWGRIARDFEMKCDYIQLDPQSQTRLTGILYPLESAARIMLRSSDTIKKGGYTIGEIKDFRLKFKKFHQSHQPGKVE